MRKKTRKESSVKSGIRFLCALSAGMLLLTATACGKTERKDKDGSAGAADSVTAADFETIESDFEYNEVAESENGYYVWERMSQSQYYPRLMFLDKESGRVVPLCNRPDCMHEGKECNAYFPYLDFGADGIDKDYLQYYEGSLYAVGLSADNYVVLYRIKEDGSEWEISTKLYRTDYAATGHWKQPEILINDGYVYFVDRKQKMMSLRRMPLGGGTAETVFEGDSDAVEIQVYRMEGHDGNIFFQVSTFLLDESFENSVGGLYRYDTATGQCDLVKADLIGPFTVHNGFVYYGSTEGLSRYSMQDGTTEILADRPMNVPNITLTKDYIILCDQMEDNTLIIYDHEGKEITTVPADLGLNWYFGGNSDMVFGEGSDGSGRIICLLDLTRPIEELRWEELKEDD